MADYNKAIKQEQDRKFAISQLEASLIQFLLTKKDIESIPGGHRRIRALTLRILCSSKEPSFAVQLGMCEAVFDAISGLKTKGSCFGLERYIRDWFLRSSIMEIIKSLAIVEK